MKTLEIEVKKILSWEKVADSVSPLAPTKPRLTPTYTSANFNLLVSLLLTGTFIPFLGPFIDQYQLAESRPIKIPLFKTNLVSVHFFQWPQKSRYSKTKTAFLGSICQYSNIDEKGAGGKGGCWSKNLRRMFCKF